jgi:multidrug resistance efflux pump
MQISKYIEKLKATLNTHRELLKCLEYRVEYNENEYNSDDNIVRLSPNDKNEIRISIIKTNSEIATLKGIINEKEKYFDNYAKFFENDLNETNANWDRVLELAKKQVGKKPELQQLISSLENIDVENDADAKVFVYKRFKGLINE